MQTPIDNFLFVEMRNNRDFSYKSLQQEKRKVLLIFLRHFFIFKIKKKDFINHDYIL